MSQFFIGVTDGNIPPDVATHFETDDKEVSIPAANLLFIAGEPFPSALSSPPDVDWGIATFSDPANGNKVSIYLTNRMTGTVSTTDDSLTTIISLTLSDTPGVYYVWGNVQSFDSTTPAGGTYSYSGGFRTDGVTATELGTELHDEFEDPSLASSDVFISASGNNVIVSVQGVAATNLSWNALLEYRLVS